MENSKMYVGNLNYATTEEDLTKLFGEYGEVKEVNIIEGRGFGFVEMVDAESAEKAKEALNEQEFQGRTLRIDEARAPKRRENHGGGGGYGGNRRGGGGGGGGGGYGDNRGGRGGRGGGGGGGGGRDNRGGRSGGGRDNRGGRSGGDSRGGGRSDY